METNNINSKLLPVVKFKIRTLSLCVRIIYNLISVFLQIDVFVCGAGN